MYALVSVSRTEGYDVEVGVICTRETFSEANEAMRDYAEDYMFDLHLEPSERNSMLPSSEDDEWTYSDPVDWYEKVKIISV